jgi:hypothetical protein
MDRLAMLIVAGRAWVSSFRNGLDVPDDRPDRDLLREQPGTRWAGTVPI